MSKIGNEENENEGQDGVFYHEEQPNMINEKNHDLIQYVEEEEEENDSIETVDLISLSSILGKKQIKEGNWQYIWEGLSSNTNNRAIEIFHRFPDKIDWVQLSKNPCDFAVQFIKANANKVVYRELSRNTSNTIVEWLIQNPQWIDWATFSENTNKNALYYLSQNQHRINYRHLSGNPNDVAVDLLLNRYKDQFWSGIIGKFDTPWTEWLMPLITTPLPPEMTVDWLNLSTNTNPRAIELLQKHPEKIDWFGVARNPCLQAILLFETTPNIAKRLGHRAYFDDKRKWLNVDVDSLDNAGKVEYWRALSSMNDNKAIEILHKNRENIDWALLSANPHNGAVYLIYEELGFIKN